MSRDDQQSSILTEMELQLLASQATTPESYNFTVYSYQVVFQLDNCFLYQAATLEQLIVMLTASSHGSALVLPDSIESHPLLNKLLTFLKLRTDIQIFWVGQMPSMALDLPDFEYCFYLTQLLQRINNWQQHVEYVFSDWLQQYPIACICKNKTPISKVFNRIGLQKINYFEQSISATEINKEQLLIIDLTVNHLNLVHLLDNLAASKKYPILILFGELPENICQTAYNLSKNKGFPILTCLACRPDAKQWQRLLHSLYAKIYLNNWKISEKNQRFYEIYNMEQQLDSYFCLPGCTKKQIYALNKGQKIGKIISAKRLLDWLPGNFQSVDHKQLGLDLNCDIQQIGLYIEEPEKIKTQSKLYAALLIAGLARLRIYWLIDNESQLSNDIIKNFPISDIIFSEMLSNQLLGDPSNDLLNFIEQAKQRKICFTASVQQNQTVNDAMSLYGIEFICNVAH